MKVGYPAIIAMMLSACGGGSGAPIESPYTQPHPRSRSESTQPQSNGNDARFVSWPDVVAPLGAAETASNDAALVVAIEDYAFLTDIAGAQRNGEDWFRFLTTIRKIPSDRVRLLFNADATDYAIKTALEELSAKTQTGDKLWFVFIGHGSPSEIDKQGLLVAADAQQTAAGLERRSLRQHEALALMGKGGGTPVAVIDACYSGRATNGVGLVPGLQPSVVVKNAVSPSAIVMTAASSSEFAGPLPGDTRPAFSYLALGGLRGWADENRDGTVTADEVVTYARGTLRVLLGAGRSQTPEAFGNKTASITKATERGPELSELLLSVQGSRSQRQPEKSEAPAPRPPASSSLPPSLSDDQVVAYGLKEFLKTWTAEDRAVMFAYVSGKYESEVPRELLLKRLETAAPVFSRSGGGKRTLRFVEYDVEIKAEKAVHEQKLTTIRKKEAAAELPGVRNQVSAIEAKYSSRAATKCGKDGDRADPRYRVCIRNYYAGALRDAGSTEVHVYLQLFDIAYPDPRAAKPDYPSAAKPDSPEVVAEKARHRAEMAKIKKTDRFRDSAKIQACYTSPSSGDHGKPLCRELSLEELAEQ